MNKVKEYIRDYLWRKIEAYESEYSGLNIYNPYFNVSITKEMVSSICFDVSYTWIINENDTEIIMKYAKEILKLVKRRYIRELTNIEQEGIIEYHDIGDDFTIVDYMVEYKGSYMLYSNDTFLEEIDVNKLYYDHQLEIDQDRLNQLLNKLTQSVECNSKVSVKIMTKGNEYERSETNEVKRSEMTKGNEYERSGVNERSETNEMNINERRIKNEKGITYLDITYTIDNEKSLDNLYHTIREALIRIGKEYDLNEVNMCIQKVNE